MTKGDSKDTLNREMNEAILTVEEYIRQAKGIARKMFGAENQKTDPDLWKLSVVEIAKMLQQEKFNEPIIINQAENIDPGIYKKD